MNYSFNSKFVQILFLFKKLRWLAPRWPTLKKDKKEQVFPLKESRLYGIGWRGALKHSDALSAALPSKLEAWGRGRITKGRRRWQPSANKQFMSSLHQQFYSPYLLRSVKHITNAHNNGSNVQNN